MRRSIIRRAQKRNGAASVAGWHFRRRPGSIAEKHAA
jgi:hypothetical protein